MNSAPVISLIVVEFDAIRGHCFIESGRMLVSVREPNTNLHHPNVLSVPTQRIPLELFDAITNRCQISVYEDNNMALEADWIDSECTDGYDPVIYAVESLLAQKLNISEGLCGKPDPCPFQAKPVWIERGSAAYPKGFCDEVEYEPIDMLGILVRISTPEAFPKATRSYNRILWPMISQFLQAYEMKDVHCIDEGLNSIELCIHGLCVAVAYTYLTRNMSNSFTYDRRRRHPLTK